MRTAMVEYFGAGSLLAIDQVVNRLRLGFGVVMTALCIALVMTGAQVLPVACAVMAVGAIAFGPQLAGKMSRVASALQPSRYRMSASACVSAALCCTLLLGATVGCTPEQQKKAKDVVGQIARESAMALPILATITSIAAGLLPAEAPLVVSIGGTAQVAIAEISKLCQSYADAPSDDTWNSLVFAVNTLVNEGAAALLDATHISDPVSRLAAQVSLGGLQTVLVLVDGYVQQARTKAQNKMVAQSRVVKLQQIEQYLNHGEIEQATGYSFDQVYQYETSLGF